MIHLYTCIYVYRSLISCSGSLWPLPSTINPLQVSFVVLTLPLFTTKKKSQNISTEKQRKKQLLSTTLFIYIYKCNCSVVILSTHVHELASTWHVMRKEGQVGQSPPLSEFQKYSHLRIYLKICSHSSNL